MTRRYFKCPIQVLHMIKEFGVEFESEDTSRFAGWTDTDIIDLMQSITCNFPSFYVAKESEDIFEPKIDDLGTLFKNEALIFYHEGWQFVSEDGEERIPLEKYEDQIKIIMRDNKHFFFGEIEIEEGKGLEKA